MIDVDVTRQFGVGLLINGDDGVEKLGDSFSAAAHRRTDGNTQKDSQLLFVQLVPLVLQFVVHVQGHHQPEVHIDELRGKVEVSLDVGGVHYVDDDVGHALQQMLAYVQFFRGVGRQGIGARQVYQGNIVVLVMEVPLLGVYGYSGVIAHVLVGAGSHIEKGGFSAVGIAHQGHTDVVVALLGHVDQGAVQSFLFFQISGKSLQVLVRPQGFAGLLLRHHLYLSGFFPSEGNLVSQDFILNGILEWSVQHHPYFFPIDKAHLDESFTETAVAVHTDNYGFFPGFQI